MSTHNELRLVKAHCTDMLLSYFKFSLFAITCNCLIRPEFGQCLSMQHGSHLLMKSVLLYCAGLCCWLTCCNICEVTSCILIYNNDVQIIYSSFSVQEVTFNLIVARVARITLDLNSIIINDLTM